MTNKEQLEDLVVTLKEVTEQITKLELSDESSVIQLEELQERQKQYRNTILRLREGGPFSLTPSLKQLLSECLEMEKMNLHRLQQFQVVIRSEMLQFKKASQAWKQYQDTYTKADSYFIDQLR